MWRYVEMFRKVCYQHERGLITDDELLHEMAVIVIQAREWKDTQLPTRAQLIAAKVMQER